MVNWVVKGLIDNKIQDGYLYHLKGKQNFYYLYTIAIIVVSNAMLLGTK
jgi:hypothetical protein